MDGKSRSVDLAPFDPARLQALDPTLQGRIWGYPGNCAFSTYLQCMASASGTLAACGLNPRYAYRPGAYR